MFGHHSLNASVAGHVAYEDLLVVHQVLARALICPVVDELLKGCIIWPFIWVWRQDGLLDMIREITSFFDFSKAIMKGPALRQEPQRVDEVAGISLNIEIVVFP